VTAHGGIGGQLAVPRSSVRPATTSAQIDWTLFSDLVARAVIVVLFSIMTIRFAVDFFATGHITGLLLVVSELLVVVMTLIRRHAASVDRSLRARVLATLSMMGPPLLRPNAFPAVAPEALTAGLSIVGLLVVIAGKVSLGRSCGLIPANRGVVSTGLYRVVRHPIYVGYVVTHVAFLAAHPSVWNATLLLTTDLALASRALCEEATLATDPAYRVYQSRVRWRVCPGLF
jgi:protein-S-isoprenylcysteine O-methyltransferase Ste14